MNFIFTCPYCKGRFNAQDSWVGQSTQCPTCHNYVSILKTGPMTVVPAVPVPQSNPQEPKNSLMARITSAMGLYGFLVLCVSIFIGFATKNLSDSGEIVHRIFCILGKIGYAACLVAGPCGIITLCMLKPEEKKQSLWVQGSKNSGACGIAVFLAAAGLTICYIYYAKS